jgi:hypothetical protein
LVGQLDDGTEQEGDQSAATGSAVRGDETPSNADIPELEAARSGDDAQAAGRGEGSKGVLPEARGLEDGVWTVLFEGECERDADQATMRWVRLLLFLDTLYNLLHGFVVVREYLVLYADHRDKLEGSSAATGAGSEVGLCRRRRKTVCIAYFSRISYIHSTNIVVAILKLGAVEEQGRLDVANVLTYKRVRHRMDYAALNKEVRFSRRIAVLACKFYIRHRLPACL